MFFVSSREDRNEGEQALVVMNNELPSISILSGKVYEVSSGGNKTKEMVDGDAITAPLRIEVSEDGDASILYPDGSSARLSPGAEIKIESGSYDTDSGSIASRIFIYSGHVWSKVVSLSTPESLWEIETPHAVATVRGTAFDTGVEDGKTEFFGSENTVDIVPVDPLTREKLINNVVSLIPERKLTLDDDTNNAVRDNVRKLVLQSFSTSESKHRDWFLQNENRDRIIEHIKKEVIDTIQDSNVTDKRKFLRDFILEKKEEIKRENLMFRPLIEEGGSDRVIIDRNVLQDNLLANPDNQIDQSKSQDPVVETKNTETTSVADQGASTADVRVAKADIRMNVPGVLVEGTEVPFKVVAVLSDGKEIDVTNEAKVKVLGGIGFIKAPGLFVALIDQDKKELGQVFGALAGEWVNQKTGITIPISTEPFSVKLKIETQTELRG